MMAATDGNNMFDAVACCLSVLRKRKVNYKTVRREVIACLTNSDAAKIKPFIDTSKYPTVDDYLNELEDGNKWGDYLCLLTICKKYEVKIQVFDARGQEFDQLVNTDRDDDTDEWPTIYLEYGSPNMRESMGRLASTTLSTSRAKWYTGLM